VATYIRRRGRFSNTLCLRNNRAASATIRACQISFAIAAKTNYWMLTSLLKTLAIILLGALIAGHHVGMMAFAFEGGPAGSVITSRAEVNYRDDSGVEYQAVSPTVTVTILPVARLVVTPDETTPSAAVGQQEHLTRVFRVCNTGNIADTYTITRAEVNSPATLTNLYFDNDASANFTTADSVVQVNGSPSSEVLSGACLGIVATVDTNDSPANSQLTIQLAARSNIDTISDRAEDEGTIVNEIGAGPRLTSPSDPGSPPLKTVNGNSQTVVSPGSSFTYSISFRNDGDNTARSVVVTDDLTDHIDYIPGSLSLENRSLTDAQDTDEGSAQASRLVVQLTEVLPGQIVNISFRATLNGTTPRGVGLINFAEVTGQNIVATRTTTAVVVVDPFGTVFSGRGGAVSPIPGAVVEFLLDQATGSRLDIPAGVGFPPNTQNSNPFTTGQPGHFSFALLPEQLGSEASPARYFIKVSAEGYSTRMLEATLRPQAGLFALTVRALDGQPIASAGAFDLVNEDVTISNLAAIALNIPMFEQRGLTLTKSVDRARAEIGDAVAYRLEIQNPTAASVSDVVVHDRLPVSFQYATGTGRLSVGSINDQPLEPEVAGGQLVFKIGEIGPGESARLLYRVRIGVNAREGEHENVATADGKYFNGDRTETVTARASVVVGSGVFSTRQIILGRVFVDTNRNHKFDDGDMPTPGVRLYLNSGQSVVTDSQGLYNFPSLGDGSQVLSLDAITLPQRYALTDNGSLAGKSWTRLLRTPLGGGALLRQNFALTPIDVEVDQNAPSLAAHSVSSPPKTETTASNQAPARISWPKQSGVSQYRVQLATDEQFHDIVSEGLVIGSEYVAAALAPGKYFWRVSPAQPRSVIFSKAAILEVKSVTTREFVTSETIEPIKPGDVTILSPQPDSVVMSPALQLDARVTLNWRVNLEVNGKAVSEQNVGTIRQDQKNNVTTFTYVGLTLRPGPNTIRVMAISAEGLLGNSSELTVMGRGPARRLEIVTEKREIQTGGRDSTTIRVQAYDQWGNPAADDQVALETSAGELLRVGEKDNATAVTTEDKSSKHDLESNSNGSWRRSDNKSSNRSNVIVSLVGGESTLKLISAGAPGEARLHARTGQIEAEAKVRITPESRPTILVGLAEMTVGQSVPEVNLRGEEGHYRNRLSFFFNGRIGDRNVLTLSYDSQRPINRTAGRDRLFQLDPLDRVYPLFGDSSTRYEAAQSNSKLYARIDRGRSYAMFGDFDANMEDLSLAGYSRKLTGVKIHLENSQGDFVTVSGARPDTAFARDVFSAGGVGLLHLTHGEILPGSEVVALEVRDRRNPEIILSRETLTRSIDYNLNPVTGELFFLRYISAFDFNFNLAQLVITYEHRADSLSTAVYTARARKNFTGWGLQLGFSGMMQRQADEGSFIVAGFDGEKSLPNKGKLRFAFARSQGEIMGIGNFFDAGDTEHNGSAYLVELNQPIGAYQGVLKARYSSSSAGFLNPFGATVTPGSRRGEVSFELKPRPSTLLRFGLTDERNRTSLVDNSRLTFSAAWEQIVSDRVRFHLGYDHRSLDDAISTRSVESNLITAGAEIKLTDKLQLSVKREQNLGEADPTYPNQTTLAATYQVNQWAKIFLTQRLAAAAISPIADFSGAGFSATGARSETAIGVETRVGKYTSMVGRYQLENGINGTDSFAVIGLQNRLPLTKEFSLELGLERGFHIAGSGTSFNSATVGFGWQPHKDFRSTGRYQFRDRAGSGQLISLGAAGRISEGITALSRFQFARTGFEGRRGSSLEGMGALAFRPLKSDRAGLLFSYTHRSLTQNGTDSNPIQTRDRLDSLATDGYFQATERLELYGRFALRFSANGQAELPFVSTMSYLTQARAQYRLTRRFDWAGEMRLLMQPSSQTRRTSYGTELGMWVLPDMRLGVGYNFALAAEPAGAPPIGPRRGFYFTISSKLSNLFDLFGASDKGLTHFAGQKEERHDGGGGAKP
jgi:uncharacterized repeat protein (TIGR01451 family)